MMGSSLSSAPQLSRGKGVEVRLLAATPDVELLIATAMLTTSSEERPSEIYEALRGRSDKVGKLIRRLVLKHGSVLEHNRLVFLAKADDGEILSLLLAHRFFEVSKLGERTWLLSCNLRTLVELLMAERRGELPKEAVEAFSRALEQVAPELWRKVVGRGG